MPLLLWPFPSGIAPPPVRTTDGKVVVIDSGHYYPAREFQPPYVGENCALAFFVGQGLPMTQDPIVFLFTKPDGTIHRGDPHFAFIGTPGASYFYSFPTGQYLMYLFDIGELDQAGVWKVQALTTNFIGGIFNFVVLPAP
jgi:hypothetical protein